MAYTTIKNRLKKAQAKTLPGQFLGRITWLISQGAYYDELTPEEQDEYRKYKESLGGVADDIAYAEIMIMFDEMTEQEAWHFKLSKREPPPTPEEHAQRVREVERIVYSLDEDTGKDE